VGTHIDVSHEAATPRIEVTARAELIEVDGRRLVFAVKAHGVDLIEAGTSDSSLTKEVRCQGRREEGTHS
jgi:fluoroacetyl-CoA thioesterase